MCGTNFGGAEHRGRGTQPSLVLSFSARDTRRRKSGYGTSTSRHIPRTGQTVEGDSFEEKQPKTSGFEEGMPLREIGCVYPKIPRGPEIASFLARREVPKQQ